MITKQNDFIRKLIREELNNLPRQILVGYHCSDVDITDYDGEISADYSDRFEMILNAIKNKFKDAIKYLTIIKENGGIEYDSDLAYEIEGFFKKIGLNWIFVDENEPLTRYGDKCYSVYFNNMNEVFSIKDHNEEDSDYSYMYFYFKNNNPILKKH